MRRYALLFMIIIGTWTTSHMICQVILQILLVILTLGFLLSMTRLYGISLQIGLSHVPRPSNFSERKNSPFLQLLTFELKKFLSKFHSSCGNSSKRNYLLMILCIGLLLTWFQDDLIARFPRMIQLIMFFIGSDTTKLVLEANLYSARDYVYRR